MSTPDTTPGAALAAARAHDTAVNKEQYAALCLADFVSARVRDGAEIPPSDAMVAAHFADLVARFDAASAARSTAWETLQLHTGGGVLS